MRITDKKELMKIISFLTMGDGSVHHNGGSKECVFSFAQIKRHSDFVFWVGGVIENLTSVSTYVSPREYPRSDVIKLQSRSLPYFTTIRDRIYIGTYKSLDPHALKLLDWQALAILYMCDGCLGRSRNGDGYRSYTTTLNLNRLSYGDQLFLKKTLKDKLDLEWNIVRTGRKYYALRLRMKDFDRFMEGIRPYLFDSFLYKWESRTTGSLSQS